MTDHKGLNYGARWSRVLNFRCSEKTLPQSQPNFRNPWSRTLNFTANRGEAAAEQPCLLNYHRPWSRTLNFGASPTVAPPPPSLEPANLLFRGEITLSLTLLGRVKSDPNLDLSAIARSVLLPSTATGVEEERTAIIWRPAELYYHDNGVRWGGAELEGRARRIKWQALEKRSTTPVIEWSQTLERSQSSAIRRYDPEAATLLKRVRWGGMEERRSSKVIYFGSGAHIRNGADIAWGGVEKGAKAATLRWERYDRVNQRDNIVWGRVGNSTELCGESSAPLLPPLIERPTYPQAVLDFNCYYSYMLHFGACIIKREEGEDYYIVENEAIITRHDDGTVIEATAAEVTLDNNSYSWRGELRAPLSELKKVADHPLIEVTLNNLTWLLKVTEVTITEEFNQKQMVIFLESSVVTLKERYIAAAKTERTSAHQLAFRTLTAPLDTGWALNWLIDDWAIEEGIAMSEQSLLERLLLITGAANAVVAADYYEPIIHVKPRYPFDYWREVRQEAQYHLDRNKLVRLRSDVEEAPFYNAALVSGEGVGVMANVKRGGGEHTAPIEVHPFITDQIVARERGRTILNRAGVKEIITSESLLHSDIPNLYPGDLVTLDSKPATVTRIRVAARWGDALVIRHALTQERHLYEYL